ncbi:MAG: glycosyltransferase family 4 protein [Acidimicrobiia bacterium]|nr:glycosyltransferase family 4 protein [Acidimicrobiia bacterium]
MRVAIICPYSLSIPGGVQGQVLGLARALRARGVDARVVGPCDGPPPEPGVVTVGATTGLPTNGSIAPIAPGPAVARRTRDALRDIDPDVVHLHEPFVPGPTISTLIDGAWPIVGTFHVSGDPSRAYLIGRPLTRRYRRRLSAAVAVSEEARETALAQISGECLLLPNGVEVGRFASASPWPAERPSIMFVGRHEPRKGLGVLLDAYRSLGDLADLWVAGEGPDTQHLRASAPDGVSWLGLIDDRELARRLRGASVFCAPSVSGESFGIVLVEAMAARTPVVASDIDGYRRVARDGREAVLVEPRAPEALADGLRRALTDSDLAERLRVAGAARAEEFSMDNLAERYLEIYESVLVPVSAP